MFNAIRKALSAVGTFVKKITGKILDFVRRVARTRPARIILSAAAAVIFAGFALYFGALVCLYIYAAFITAVGLLQVLGCVLCAYVMLQVTFLTARWSYEAGCESASALTEKPVVFVDTKKVMAETDKSLAKAAVKDDVVDGVTVPHSKSSLNPRKRAKRARKARGRRRSGFSA